VEAAPEDRTARAAETEAFLDWALLELLLQSGVRIEEACELTTLDVLKRRQPEGRVYYLLHPKPSKFDRARVIPIGDGLGRVLAEMIAHVKAFYAEATRADGTPLVLRPHDCRRLFASLAARELEIQRIGSALRRSDELTDDAAAALEAVA